METTILLLIARPPPLLAASTEAVSMIIRRRCAAWERVEPRKLILSKVIRGGIGAITRRHVLHLMGLLLGIEHHLLISPLCELSVGSWIKIRILLGYLSRCVRRMTVHIERLLLLGWVLVEGRVKWLGSNGWGPTSLWLLLHRVRIWLLLCWWWCRLLGRRGRRRWGMIICRRRALAWN
jgi:hypothetical protein